MGLITSPLLTLLAGAFLISSLRSSALPNLALSEQHGRAVIKPRGCEAVGTTSGRDPVDGLSGLGWPAYNASESTLVRLGYGNGFTGPGAMMGYLGHYHRGPARRTSWGYS